MPGALVSTFYNAVQGSPPAPGKTRLWSEGGVTLLRAVKHFTSSPTFELGSSHFYAASGQPAWKTRVLPPI